MKSWKAWKVYFRSSTFSFEVRRLLQLESKESFGEHIPTSACEGEDLQQRPSSHKSLCAPWPMRKITVNEHKVFVGFGFLTHTKAALGVCGLSVQHLLLMAHKQHINLERRGCGAFSTQHRGCCCLPAPEMLIQTHHGPHWRVSFISSGLQSLYKVCSSLILLAQRPPKCTSYQNHHFKAEEKRVSKHLKAQMEAENFLQCCRKCHLTIPKSVEVMTLTLTAEFHFQPSSEAAEKLTALLWGVSWSLLHFFALPWQQLPVPLSQPRALWNLSY